VKGLKFVNQAGGGVYTTPSTALLINQHQSNQHEITFSAPTNNHSFSIHHSAPNPHPSPSIYHSTSAPHFPINRPTINNASLNQIPTKDNQNLHQQSFTSGHPPYTLFYSQAAPMNLNGHTNTLPVASLHSDINR
jgi:hypothetical protein